MAVAHSAASESHTGTTGSASQAAFSWTHTQTGTPQGVLVFVSTYASVADLITSVTYGGVALTRLTGGLAQDGAGELGRLDTFFLGSGLGTGNQTITVNRTNNATVMYAAAATVTAAANTAVPTSTIVLLQGDGTLTVQSVDDTSPGVNSLRYAGTYSGLNAPPTAGTGSTLLNSIDIGNYGSALVRETTAGQGARNVGFSGATDDRAAVHLAIRELVPRTETPIVGAFTLTGSAATLAKASPKVMTGDRGAFTLTANPADLRHNPDIEAGVGGFTLTGNPADARHNVRITGERGQFALTGQPATLSKAAAAKILTADVGTFALNGGSPTLSVGHHLDAATGQFTLTGNPAGLADTDRLVAETGTFTLASNGATLRHTRTIQAGPGTFTLTGNAASLTELGAYEIDPITGAFTFTGNPATLVKVSAKQLTADVGTFNLTGQPATFKQTYSLTGLTGNFTFTGNPALLTKQTAKKLSATTGAFNFAGNPTALVFGKGIAAERGHFLLTANPNTLLSRTYVFSPATSTFLLTGAPTTFTYEQRRRVILIF